MPMKLIQGHEENWNGQMIVKFNFGKALLLDETFIVQNVSIPKFSEKKGKGTDLVIVWFGLFLTLFC